MSRRVSRPISDRDRPMSHVLRPRTSSAGDRPHPARRYGSLERVRLRADLPEHGLKRGERGTVVHVFETAEAYLVEFVSPADGSTARSPSSRPTSLAPAGAGRSRSWRGGTAPASRLISGGRQHAPERQERPKCCGPLRLLFFSAPAARAAGGAATHHGRPPCLERNQSRSRRVTDALGVWRINASGHSILTWTDKAAKRSGSFFMPANMDEVLSNIQTANTWPYVVNVGLYRSNPLCCRRSYLRSTTPAPDNPQIMRPNAASGAGSLAHP